MSHELVHRRGVFGARSPQLAPLALRDLDQAVAVAEHAVRCLGGVDSARSTATLDDLRDKLAAHRDVPIVRDFLDLTA
ncbi:hypothetical protein ACFFHJ_39740 [Planotetraspora thailandica]|uniref:hypothetical protein n=1 Tax=Planotetraspora thailandica TaxID=487172 RepID=UPI00194F3A63|nr:hypothetical protein [Planotetraspora thailandica]